MNLSEIRAWIQIGISLSTFLAVLLAGYKVVGIAHEGVQSHEKRITYLEEQHTITQTFITQVVAMAPKLEVLAQEIERLRNRLDRFLDTQSNVRRVDD